MKRLTMLVALLLALASLTPAPAEGEPEKALTLMIYMCGSNLESQYGSACADIEEMRASGVDAEAVNVLLLTGGSARWHTGQGAGTVEVRSLRPSRRSGENRWAIEKTLPARSMGDAQTLTDFLGWGVRNYPAQKYALILWDHGAGPLEGICLDELNAPDRLGVDELARALGEAKLPGKLGWIGMDACLMATAEVAKAVSPYAEYMIASQETEPADGWDYAFLKGIEDDWDGAATGRRIVDGYFESQGGDAMGLTLSCLDLSRINRVAEAMNGFFEPIGRSMDSDTFARLSALRTQSTSFGRVVRGLTADGYDLVDLGDLLSRYGALGDNHNVRWALASAVTYKRPEGAEYSGLSVYHPLRNKAGYQQGWKQRYARMDFSEGYQKYLNSFGTLLTGKELADWSGIALSDDGFNAAGENLYSLQLTPLQRENFASAQLILLGAVQSGGGDEAVYGAQLSGAGAATGSEQFYYPVLIDEVSPNEAGTLEAGYTGRSLYLTDESGNAVAGPIGYQRSDDGAYWYISATYYDWSGREDAVDSARVLYTCAKDGPDGELKVVDTEVYDSLTGTYTRRLGFDETDFTEMYIDRLARAIPGAEGALPGFADWEEKKSEIEVALPLKWRLRFFDEQMSGTQLFATLQITDVQQNSYCTPPIPVENPNLYNIGVLPRQIVGNGYELTLYAVQDSSPLNPGLNIGAAFKNTSHRAMTCDIGDIVLNGHRRNSGVGYLSVYDVEPGRTGYAGGHLDRAELAGLGDLTALSFELATGYADAPASERVSRRCSVALSGCDADAMGGGAVEPLDEVVRGDETWQLVALKRNARGGLSGTLRVVNDGEKTIYGAHYLVVNDCLQTDRALSFSVPPHTDACVPFEFENSVYGSDLVVTGAKGSRYRYMGVDHLMERFGIAGVTSLKLCRADGDTPVADSVAFEWDQPIPIADAGDIGRYEPLGETSRLLLDGEFAVNVDRLLAADDGVALRLLITNRADRDLYFALKYPTVNGLPANLGAYSWENREYAVGAGATLVANVALKKSGVEAVDGLGLCFRYGNFTTHSAGIIPNAPLPLGAEGGTWLSGADVAVVPVDNARPDSAGISVAPESLDVAGAALGLSAGLANDRRVYTQAAVDGSAVLALGLRAENPSEDTLDITFSDFTVNDARYVGGEAYIRSLAPGGAGECALEIGAAALAGLDEITAVSCTAEVRRNGDWGSRQQYPVRFRVSGIPLDGVVPEPGKALGEAQSGGLSMKVLSLREDDRGALKGALLLRNDAGTPVSEKYGDLYVGGVLGGIVDIALPANADRIVEFTFKNEVDVRYTAGDFGGQPLPDASHLLQRMGMEAVESVSLLRNRREGDDLMTARLDAPVPLSPWDGRDLAGAKPLLAGDVSVGATHLAMTDSGLFVTLAMRNDSTEPRQLSLVAADGDGCALEIDALNRAFVLPSGTARVVNARFTAEKSMADGEGLSGLTLSFIIDGALAEGAAVRLDVPFTVGKAALRGAEAFDAIPAQELRPVPALLEPVGAPGATRVHAARLVAPVDAGKAARFDHGYAAVCVRDEKRACLRELCRVPLAKDGEALVAPFGGMVLWDGYKPLFTEQTASDGGAALLSRVVLYAPDRPFDPALSGRLSERGYGLLSEGWWMLNEGESGPAIREGSWTLKDLGTGDPCGMPAAAAGWKAWSEQPLHFDGDLPDTWEAVGISVPGRLTLIPVQALDAELAVRYELYYAGGDSEAITMDDALDAIHEPDRTRPAQPDNLGELEPDGGGSIAVTPDVFETERFRVSVSARLKQEDGDDAGRQVRLGLCMRVENRTDINIDAVSTGLVLNGERRTDTKWLGLRIGPASTFEDIWYIEPEDLRAVGALSRIQCTLNLCDAGGDGETIESIPIDVALPPMDEAALPAQVEALGATGVYGVTWQLLSAQIDEYGRVTGRLNAVNHTDTAWELSDNAVLANGYRATSVLSDFRLEPRGSRELFFSFENFAWADCYGGGFGGEEAREVPQTEFVLQSHGVAAVTELTFALGMEYDFQAGRAQPKQILTFPLPEPLAVPAARFDGRSKPLLMQAEGLSVRLESVLLGEESVSLALEVRNDTDGLWDLELDHVNLDGSHIYGWNWKEYGFTTVLPHTTQCCCVSAYLTDGDFLAQGGIADIHLCFWVTDTAGNAGVYRAARVRLGEPLAQAGDLVRSGDCEVWPAAFAGTDAPGLTDTLCLPPAARVRPRTLTPPIDGERAALFEGGEASICIRQEWDDPDTPELKSCRTLSREIVSLPLRRDAGSGVCAEYSGMALAFWASPFPMREQTRDGESEIDATVYLLRDYYDAYKVRDPGTDGQTPDVAPVGEPSYVTEEPVAPAVKAGLAYRVGRDGDGLACRDARVAFVDMDTGKALAGSVTDWMYHSMMICNAWRDDDYAHTLRLCMEFGGNAAHYPCLMPVEHFAGEYWDDAELVVRYHIQYADGTEEILTEPY